jgi:Zn-dependent peptidase ImmA (M78 family)
MTEFAAGQKPLVQINRDLTATALDDDDRPDWLLGRWRATLAHEAAHVLLHACLFVTNPNQGTLFPDDEEEEPDTHKLHRCLKRNVLFRGSPSDWREIQANMGMAALLMPKKLFTAAFAEIIEGAGFNSNIARESVEGEAVAKALAGRFQVSRQAAAIRLETLQLLAQADRRTLL